MSATDRVFEALLLDVLETLCSNSGFGARELFALKTIFEVKQFWD